MESRILRRPALCQACGAPGLYTYELRGPVERDNEKYVEVSYSFKCEICGHEDKGRLFVPLEALYRIRHLLVPEALALVERVKVISDVVPLGLKAEAGAEAQDHA
ncbi:MAG: hypothetical protein ACP5HK_01925 [Acidilobus sp.]